MTTTGVGLPAQRWAGALSAVPEIDAPPCREGRVLVLAAHPDDETLGLGGTLRRLLQRGCAVQVVVATDGDAAYGTGARSAGLGELRRRELAAALAALGLPADPVLLGLPDGHVAEHHDRLLAALRRLGEPPDLVLAPWRDDPHPDHRAVGSAAACYAGDRDLPLWEYPVWMRHWTDPSDPVVQWDRLRVVRLSSAEQDRKSAAIGCHASQIRAADDQEPVLPDYVLIHFADGLEPLFAPA